MSSSKKAKTKAADTADHVAAGRRVLAIETEALAALETGLDANFSRAVECLAGAKGRVIVSGMGKSGHIAGKIAATLASTGTPAHYVHPGEASHGDLGMVTKDDVVLCLSNSGETRELTDLVTYARRFGIPLLAIVGRADSTLAEASDVALVLPAVPEACPMGLAPTTSTTAMLALGDALAVALLERKGFSADDFQVLHPGGKLGQSLIKIADIMHDGDALPLCNVGTRMADALIVITSKSFGCVGVIDQAGDLLGVVTDGDLRRHMSADLLDQPVERVMTKRPQTIRSRALAAEALGLMNARKITSLFVVEGAKPVGIVHVHDCLRAGVA